MHQINRVVGPSSTRTLRSATVSHEKSVTSERKPIRGSWTEDRFAESSCMIVECY